MAAKPDAQPVSNLWSCDTLQAGIEHVHVAAKPEPVSDDEEERDLLKALEDSLPPIFFHLFSN